MKILEFKSLVKGSNFFTNSKFEFKTLFKYSREINSIENITVYNELEDKYVLTTHENELNRFSRLWFNRIKEIYNFYRSYTFLNISIEFGILQSYKFYELNKSMTIRNVVLLNVIFSNNNEIIGAEDYYLTPNFNLRILDLKIKLAISKYEILSKLPFMNNCDIESDFLISNPKTTGVLIHETIGHQLEGDMFCSFSSSSANNAHQTKLTIIDNGQMDHYGYCQIDDEGIYTKQIVLFESGKLMNRMHSNLTAKVFNKTSTGHARSANLYNKSSPRMTCTYAKPGIIGLCEIEDSDYVYLSLPENGSYFNNHIQMNMRTAFFYRKGKPAARLCNLKIGGSTDSILGSVLTVYRDFQIHANVEGCSKNGQNYLPVSYGGPHMKLSNTILREGQNEK
jgi:hypothetical protein